MDSDEKELFDAVKDSLEAKGVLDKIGAEIRTHVVQIIKGQQDRTGSKESITDHNPENFVINELIKEYLDWNGYKNAATVLSAESGQPKDPLDRSELEDLLNVRCGPNAQQVPLLYTLVASFSGKSVSSASEANPRN